jgi:hypothetical protein
MANTHAAPKKFVMAGPDPATQGGALNAKRLNHEKHELHEGARPSSLVERFVFFVKFVVQYLARRQRPGVAESRPAMTT